MERFVYSPADLVEVVAESDLAGMGIRPVGATAESRFIYAGDDPVEVVTEDELDSLGIDPISDLGDEDE
jgi:hypothetical protein